MSIEEKFVILLAGDVEVNDRLLSRCRSARVVAADSGIEHAQALGLKPEFWVGDFDSSSQRMLDKYSDVQKQSFEREKDQTDGSLAIKSALELGAKEIILIGATGGERSDHSLGVLFEMLAYCENGLNIYGTTGAEEYWPISSNERSLDLPTNSMFSILALSGLSGLTIEGAKYPLENETIEFGSTHTLSNVALGQVRVQIASGRAIVIARPDDFSGV